MSNMVYGIAGLTGSLFCNKDNLAMSQDDNPMNTVNSVDVESLLLRSRERLNNVKENAKTACAKCYALKLKYESACRRLEQLKGGKGLLLASKGPLEVYEFWLSIPVYSGTIKGVTAQLTQHGDVQQVAEVKGKTSGGLGGAVIGGAIFGPVGAVVGAIASRKMTITTENHEVDTRQFELEVIGPNFAWSTIQTGDQYLSSFHQIRDYINNRGRQDESIEDAITAQLNAVEEARVALDNAKIAEQEALAASVEADTSYNSLLNERSTHNSQSSPTVLKAIKAWFFGAK